MAQPQIGVLEDYMYESLVSMCGMGLHSVAHEGYILKYNAEHDMLFGVHPETGDTRMLMTQKRLDEICKEDDISSKTRPN